MAPQLPPWETIRQQMVDAGESAESINQALNEYSQLANGGGLPSSAGVSMPAPKAGEVRLPSASGPVLESMTAGGRKATVYNQAQEEMKKNTEFVAAARQGLASLDEIFSVADNLIPAADMVKIGPFQSSIMGKVHGLQADISKLTTLNDTGIRSWEGYKKSIASLMARSMGEKGVLTDADIERVNSWMPKPDDSSEMRINNKKNIKNFLSVKINTANHLLRSLGAKVEDEPIL